MNNNINDDYVHPLSANMQQQCQTRTLTQEYTLHMVERSNGIAPFTPQQAALHKYPQQFLCNFTNAVLNDKTGDLLEYCHLINHPKHKAMWSKCCLGQRDNTSPLQLKHFFSSTKTKFQRIERAT
jgi:hypothetical protein